MAEPKPDRVKVMVYEPYPFKEAAGNIRTLRYILQFIDKDLLDVHVVVPFSNGFLETLDNFDVKTSVLEPARRLRRYGGKAAHEPWYAKLLTAKDVLTYTRDMRKFIKANGIDVIYCNGVRAVVTVGIAAKLCGIPVLWFVKGQLEHRMFDTFSYWLAKRIIFYSKVNFQDRYPWLQKFFALKVGFIKTGLAWSDVEAARNSDKTALREELGINNDIVNIAYIGQLYEPKGVHFLIEALVQVVERFNAVRIYIVGSSIIDEYRNYQEHLERIVVTAGLSEKVMFLGWRKDAMQIISIMDIIVHPSLAEGFSRSVLEAMALGRAVIATGVGGERETIQSGVNGLLVPPADAIAIAEAICSLLVDDGLRRRIGEAAEKTIYKEHRIEEKIHQLGEEFYELGRGKRSQRSD